MTTLRPRVTFAAQRPFRIALWTISHGNRLVLFNLSRCPDPSGISARNLEIPGLVSQNLCKRTMATYGSRIIGEGGACARRPCSEHCV